MVEESLELYQKRLNRLMEYIPEGKLKEYHLAAEKEALAHLKNHKVFIHSIFSKPAEKSARENICEMYENFQKQNTNRQRQFTEKLSTYVEDQLEKRIKVKFPPLVSCKSLREFVSEGALRNEIYNWTRHILEDVQKMFPAEEDPGFIKQTLSSLEDVSRKITTKYLIVTRAHEDNAKLFVKRLKEDVLADFTSSLDDAISEVECPTRQELFEIEKKVKAEVLDKYKKEIEEDEPNPEIQSKLLFQMEIEIDTELINLETLSLRQGANDPEKCSETFIEDCCQQYELEVAEFCSMKPRNHKEVMDQHKKAVKKYVDAFQLKFHFDIFEKVVSNRLHFISKLRTDLGTVLDRTAFVPQKNFYALRQVRRAEFR